MIAGQTIWVLAKGFAPDEGGQQTYAEQVALAYARQGARVVVLTQTSAGPRRTDHAGLKLIDIGPGKSLHVPVRFLAAMRSERRQHGAPLFVHGTTWRTSLLPMVLKLPYVTSFHGREFIPANAISRCLIARVANQAVMTVAVSHYSAARLAKAFPELANDPTVLWNGISPGIDQTHAAGRSNAPLRIFSLCRLEPRKNIRAALSACTALLHDGHDFEYVIGGRGPELAAIEADIAGAGLSAQVTASGVIPANEIAARYRHADIFLHPQIALADDRDFEGFGLVIADAMAAGCAVIAGLDGAPAELIVNGQTGLLVDGRSAAAIRLAIAELLRNPSLRSQLGSQARTFALQNFSWDAHVSAIADTTLRRLAGYAPDPKNSACPIAARTVES